MVFFNEFTTGDYFKLVTKQAEAYITGLSDDLIYDSDVDSLSLDVMKKCMPSVPEVGNVLGPEIVDRKAKGPFGNIIDVEAAVYKISIVGGDLDLMRCVPTNRKPLIFTGALKNRLIEFEVMLKGRITGNDAATEPIRKEVEEMLDFLKDCLAKIKDDCDFLKDDLYGRVISIVKKRKEQIRVSRDTNSKLKF